MISSRPLTVEVSSYQGRFLGPHRLFITGINPAPESVSSVPVSGQVISGETLGIPGDLDEFTFNGQAGDLYTLFVEASGSTPGQTVNLAMTDSPNAIARIVDTVGGRTLLQTSPGTYTMPYTGTYHLQVDGTSTEPDEPYRVLLTDINPAPEHVPAVVTVNDTVIGETLDPGDIDEFVVHLTAGDTVQVGTYSDPPGSDFQADVVIAGLFQWRGPSRPAQTLIITRTDDYTIWVRGVLEAGQTGAYRLWVTPR